MDRRDFLKAVAAGAGSLAASSAAAQTPGPQRAIPGPRTYVAGNFALEMDNVPAGWLNSAEGGSASSDVILERTGPDRIERKHLGGVKYENIRLEFGTGMSKGIYNWIKSTLDRRAERHNGAVISANYEYRETSRLTFQNALITEIGLPTLDAAAKDAAKITLTIAPELTRLTRSPAGSAVAVKLPGKEALQKRWLPSNFRLRIDGLDRACSRVNKIEALTIKQALVGDSVGERRDYQKEPGKLEIPNLVITVAESYADDLYKWHEDFVIRGNQGQEKEKSGILEYLTPNLQEVLFVVTFRNLGIFRLTPDKSEAGAENIRRMKAEMYCEDLRFDYKSAIG